MEILKKIEYDLNTNQINGKKKWFSKGSSAQF